MPLRNRRRAPAGGRRHRNRAARYEVDWARLAPCLALVVIGLALLPGFRDHLTSDGVSYLSIAEHYAAGHVSEAVNAYWSPMFSWLMVPLVAVGVPGTLAAKLVSLGTAVGVLLATRRLSRTLGVGERALGLLSWGLVIPLVAAAYATVGPDLLVALPILLYADRLVAADGQGALRTGVVAGAFGAASYLTKLFALPFLLVHLLFAGVLLARRHGAGAAVRTIGAATGVLALGVAAWGSVLTVTYGHPTVGSAATTNLEFATEGSRGAEPFWAGLIPPPHEHAVSAWEDLPRSLEQRETVATDDTHTADDGGGWAPGGLVRQALDQSGQLAATLAWWAPVVLLAVATPVALYRLGPPRRRGRHVAARDPSGVVLLAVGAVVWTAGVAVTFVEARYLLAPLLLAAPLAALTLDAWRTAAPRSGLRDLLAVGLVVGLLPWAGSELSREWRASDNVVRQAGELASQVELEGARVASQDSWIRSVGLCYAAGCHYYGMPAAATVDQFVDQLDRHDISYLVAYRPLPDSFPFGDPVAVSADGRTALYEVP